MEINSGKVWRKLVDKRRYLTTNCLASFAPGRYKPEVKGYLTQDVVLRRPLP